MINNSSKRTTLKILAVASGALAAPGLVAAACKHDKSLLSASLTHKPGETAVTALRGTGLVISFSRQSDQKQDQKIVITNTTDQPVVLSQVYPGVVATGEDQFDLNSLMANGPLEFAPKQATTLSIKRLQHSAVNATNTALPHSVGENHKTTLIVRTHNPKVNFGEPIVTHRTMV